MKKKNRTIHEKARDLIYQVWCAMEWDKVSSSRRMKIYDEYTSKIKSAACTDNLRKFLERLCAKMGVRSVSDSQSICDILSGGDETCVLDVLRDETQYVVLLMREIVEAKKMEREENEKMEAKLVSTMDMLSGEDFE